MPRVIYQERRPRVLLVDFPEAISAEITSSLDLNLKIAETIETRRLPKEFGKTSSWGMKSGLGFLEEEQKKKRTFKIERATNEFDIVILNANYSQFDLRAAGFDPLDPFSDKIQVLGGRWELCTKLLTDTLAHNEGLFLIFVGENAQLGTTRFLGTSLTFELTGFDIAISPYTIVEPDNVFHIFIRSNVKELQRIPAITATGFKDCIPLIQDDQNPTHTYACLLLNNGLIVLPRFRDLPGKIGYLLAKVLPKLKPNLFPDIKDLAYLNDPAYLPKEITELLKQNEAIANEKEALIHENLKKIEAIKKSKEHLTKLLSSKGDDLHLACQKALEEILQNLNANLQVINTDVNDDMRDVDRRRKEDLRIVLPEKKVVLIDVRGAESNLGPGVVNDMDEHRNIFLKHHRDFRPEDVFSVALLNNQITVDPRNRDELFGSRTGEIQERLAKAGYSAISTAELFGLHRRIFYEESRPELRDFLKRLTKRGINTFEDLPAKVEE